jgi:PAS domain S-box-containing protein
MPAMLRVLIVEDSEDDALLLMQQLRRGPWQVTSERVQTAAEMSAALDKKKWDLIVADYSMPGFSGPAALELAISRKSDLPFILVSGAVGEETAVQAMKAGADDYLSKQNLSRLLPAVQRELRKAEERRSTQRIEQELRKREAHLADALQLAGIGTWHLDLLTNTAVWSDRACLILDFNTEPTSNAFEALLGRLHPEDRKLLPELFQNPSTQEFSQDFQIVRTDGAVRYVQIRGDVIRDADSRPIEAAGMIQDITERKQSEKALAESQQRLLGIVTSAMDAIITVDDELNVILFNPAAERMFRIPADQAVGGPLSRFVPARFHPGLMERISLLRDTETTALALEGPTPLVGLRSDGVEFPIEGTLSNVIVGGENLFTAMVRDVSERARADLELAKAKEDAEAANRAKSEFLANMSHEIRTPMTAIVGFAETLLSKSPEECAKIGSVQIIRRNALHLLELINEILDLSKIEAGEMKVERIACDLPGLLSDLVALMRPRAEEKGLGFEVEFVGPIPSVIETDPTRLRQIMVNLLGNAMKFTKAGTIGLRITDEGDGGPRTLLRVDVRDTGIGMTPELLRRLFRPFTQGDESITRKFGGTGLGLTISQRFAELLGGKITVASEVNVGSTFTLRIDGGPSEGIKRLQGLTEATLPSLVDQTTKAQMRIAGRVLLVEDGRDNQRLLRMYLTDAGAEVASALNGQIALDLVAAEKFDVILMDMQMPVLDGYAATAEIRRRGLKVPIIALTAYAMAEDRAKCIASGCSDYMSKPVNEEKLLKTINQHLSSSARTEDSPKPPATAAPGAVADGDSAKIRSSFADNPRMMRIVPEFVAGLPGDVAKILELLARNEVEPIRRIVHQLLGVCGGYGFEAVTVPARAAEHAIDSHQPLETITASLNTLISVIRRIEGYDETKRSAAA